MQPHHSLNDGMQAAPLPSNMESFLQGIGATMPDMLPSEHHIVGGALPPSASGAAALGPGASRGPPPGLSHGVEDDDLPLDPSRFFGANGFFDDDDDDADGGALES